MDRKIIIYGLREDGGNPGSFDMIPFLFDVYGFLPVDINLAGTTLFSASPFANIGVVTGLFDWVPALTANYMAGTQSDPFDGLYYAPQTFTSLGTIGNPSDSLQVAPLTSSSATDAPAAATAANIQANATVGFPVIVTGIQVTLNCVADQLAPILVTITEDPDGTPNIVWSARLTGSAGETVVLAVPLNITCQEAAAFDVEAPAATNFVTLSAQFNGGVGGPSLFGGVPT